ncbi:hypothetical protein [Duganella sp. Root1480D1]|uniref:hypothetical protein n=1 Tax=Duganella sp. Root1480D1 TaxID=1736471 RepID=UPI000710AF63|nr:hypothetical protein [Duganella sp. Root1480D1]KQZ40018.1 hypothetical protein ASD58_06455 [Duganella sp. Root1480D1]
MPFKAFRLKRTDTFYPSMGGTPDLGSLLKSIKLTQEFIDDIIDIEDAAFADRKNGASPDALEKLLIAAKKESLLTGSLHRKVYFHILRQSQVPKKYGKGDMDTLLLSYHDIMAESHRGYPSIRFPRLDGVHLFGHHGDCNFDQEAMPNHDEFKHRMAVLKQCDKYIHIPGMLDKIEKFRPFAEDGKTARRALGLLRALNYDPSDYPSRASTANYWINLKFWGFVTIILLNEACRQDFFAGFAAEMTVHPHCDEYMQILERFVGAVGDNDLGKQFVSLKAGVAGNAAHNA